ncbi:hypothetical protein D3C84_1059280 [compost metagenome]
MGIPETLLAADHLHDAFVAAVALGDAVAESSVPKILQSCHEFGVGVEECRLTQ